MSKKLFLFTYILMNFYNYIPALIQFQAIPFTEFFIPFLLINITITK